MGWKLHSVTEKEAGLIAEDCTFYKEEGAVQGRRLGLSPRVMARCRYY